jgi:hypothetical protein
MKSGVPKMSDDVMERQAKTLPIPEAGRKYFGLGRNASYAAAKRGDIPTIQIGRLLRAPVVALERRLEEAGQTAAVKRLDPISQGGPRRRRSARVSP